MFSNIIIRNNKRSRQENGLFFSSLVISIVAFYLILSLSKQDVVIFLQTMESDAVNKLLLLVPVFYVLTLGILFFLIYFACKYQIQRRRHEFGVYRMLGMKKIKLFSMLLAEDVMSSILALLIGLPVAIFLSEMISLVLLCAGNQIVPSKELAKALWGTDEFIDENALQVNMTRLKKTMLSLNTMQKVETVRGQGYRLERREGV